MKNGNRNYPILLLSIPLLTGVIFTSYTGFFTSGFYEQETLNWQVQSWGQDLIDLFVISPVLFLSSLWAFQGHKFAMKVWAGSTLYLTYTFVIFCFDVHFNSLFLFYCFNLGLSFYSILYFISQIKKVDYEAPFPKQRITKLTSIYFLVISILFYALWISDIIPSLSSGMAPAVIKEVGLPTNPVHVLDLAILLPGVFISGILLWKGKILGRQFAPVILVFFILMDITIGTLTWLMYKKDLTESLTVMWIMLVLIMFSLALLVSHINTAKKEIQLSNGNEI